MNVDFGEQLYFSLPMSGWLDINWLDCLNVNNLKIAKVVAKSEKVTSEWEP